MSRVRRAVVAGAGALVLAVTAGCGAAGTDTAPVVAPPSPATADAEATAPIAPDAPEVADAADVRASGTAVIADGVTVLHALPADAATAVHAQPEGAHTLLTLDPGGPEQTLDVLLAAPDGARIEPQEDGSLLVVAADGGFLGGAAPATAATGGTPPRFTAVTDGLVRLETTGPVSTRVGAAALASTDWGDREGGRSLAVEPTPWARQAGLAGEAGVWAELVEAVPEAKTQVMYDQLVCHAVGAPDKATWNLEPWRPDIGVLKIMMAGCNPT